MSSSVVAVGYNEDIGYNERNLLKRHLVIRLFGCQRGEYPASLFEMEG